MLNGGDLCLLGGTEKTMAKIRHASDQYNYGKPVVCHNAKHTRTFLFVPQSAVTLVHYKSSIQTCYYVAALSCVLNLLCRVKDTNTTKCF